VTAAPSIVTPAAANVSYASEIDAFTHGQHNPRGSSWPPPLRRRIETPVTAGRYHLYASWTSTSSHHVAILRTVLGLEGAISLSYVDSLRDGRGWAFRRRTGADPINGFTLLRQAYQATDPSYAGEVRVPLLWDRQTQAVASDHPATIIADLLDGYGGDAVPSLATGNAVAAEVQHLERSFADELNASAALRDAHRRPAFRRALRQLDQRLDTRPYLTGDRLSDADVRLWVRLVRLDAGPNAAGTLGPRLDHYRHLWRWAAELAALPAFSESTEITRFAAPFADLPPWPEFPR
jgi:glutathionyl-hydroquinone reductase